MATGGVSPEKLSRTEGNTVKLFITSYTDDFFAEREFLKREVKKLFKEDMCKKLDDLVTFLCLFIYWVLE